MLGHETRDARRTERYLDGLLAADERRAPDVPADVNLDSGVRFAAGELRADLTRVHPSFRFEDALASRLMAGAARIKAGLPIEVSRADRGGGTVAPFPGRSARASSSVGDADVAAAQAVAPAAAVATTVAPAAAARFARSAAAFRRLPDKAAHPSRPLIVGGVGVGVASAALSLGAVYVAWRHSHPASGGMGRAARAAHGRTRHSGRQRRTGVINGILGVVS
jgi:hypothetical protein